MSVVNQKKKPVTGRKYIIALNTWHSRLALAASVVTVFLSLFAIAGGIVLNVKKGDPAEDLFRWFTINSNSLTAFAAFMIIPFAVEGMRRKHFSYPKWVAWFHYSGMVCTTLTMVFSVGFISWVDPVAAFGGYNIYLHIICPILVLVSFFLVESGYRFSLRESVLATIPVFLYEILYYVEVFIIGDANGGWEDFYHMGEFVPVWVSVAGITVLGLGISLLIGWLNNRKSRSGYRRRIAGLWPLDVSPVEIKIEIFGLGRFMGKHSDADFVELPVSLFRLIADRYDLRTEELVAPYTRGFLDSLKDKNLLSGKDRRTSGREQRRAG